MCPSKSQGLQCLQDWACVQKKTNKQAETGICMFIFIQRVCGLLLQRKEFYENMAFLLNSKAVLAHKYFALSFQDLSWSEWSANVFYYLGWVTAFTLALVLILAPQSEWEPFQQHLYDSGNSRVTEMCLNKKNITVSNVCSWLAWLYLTKHCCWVFVQNLKCLLQGMCPTDVNPTGKVPPGLHTGKTLVTCRCFCDGSNKTPLELLGWSNMDRSESVRKEQHYLNICILTLAGH